MKHTFIECSDAGLVRKQNEDSAGHAANEHINAQMFCVADGMGGYGAGDLASKLVVQSVVKEFSSPTHLNRSLEAMIFLLFSKAHQALKQIKKEKQINSIIGTTLSMIVITPENLAYANIGDSRIYCFDGTRLIQKSVDHTFVNDLVSKNMITPEQAKTHPKKHVLTRAITGDGTIEPFIAIEPFLNKDYLYLLCSDGLYNMVSESFVSSVLKRSSIFDVKKMLLQEAYANGARDNITFQIIRPFDGDETIA
jgi:PPM family protein phosphatase